MKAFNKKIQERFDMMCQTGKLFRVELTGDKIWDLYLGSFSREDNPVFRDTASTAHNCNNCNNFIRRYGNIVSIDENYNITTMFDVVTDNTDSEYKNTAEVLSEAIKSSKVTEVFFETFDSLKSLPYEHCTKSSPTFQLGIASNSKRYTKEEAEKFGVVKPNEVRTFNHMYLSLDRTFVDTSGKSIEAIVGEYRDSKNVFQRAMETISLDTLQLVRDLINQGSLLDGATHLFKIEKMIPLKEEYNNLPANQRDNWLWVKSFKLPFAKFKNELIGVLCSELSEGEELNKACQSWNKRVDPANYMKVTAPITKRQIEEAKEFVEKNGFAESFNRRFATIDDIKVSEILHSNVGEGIKSVSIFDNVKSTSTRHKRNEFDGVEEVTIDKFMKDILPTCTSVEAFLTNNQEGNLVSMTTTNNPESKPIFKWDNNYSWTFNGNLAGKSQIKEEVMSKGGVVDGVLRFSCTWGDRNGDHSDLDIWCLQPDRTQIGFNSGYRRDRGNMFTSCGGQLDLDDRGGSDSIKVENIYFRSMSELKDGKYMFWINPYAIANSKGFKAEIEFDGEIYSYSYNNPVRSSVGIAEVIVKNGEFSIEHKLQPTDGSVSREVYGLETNQFHKVNLICLSPNHWDENNVGNKHYLFMLDGCKSPTSIRSFHNENLLPELAAHRKVLEVLGATNMIETTEKQLSGLGFNATVRDELIVKLQGTHKRIIKIKF
jgi:hypothetical protein